MVWLKCTVSCNLNYVCIVSVAYYIESKECSFGSLAGLHKDGA